MAESRGVGRVARDRSAHVGSRGAGRLEVCGGDWFTRAHKGFSRSDAACTPLAQWVDRLTGLGDGTMNSIYIYTYTQTQTTESDHTEPAQPDRTRSVPI
jgi:hypothetical protein